MCVCVCVPMGYVVVILPVFVQGMLEMAFSLPTDTREASGLSLVRRIWVARFDVEEEARGLAEKYVESVSYMIHVYIHNLILK